MQLQGLQPGTVVYVLPPNTEQNEQEQILHDILNQLVAEDSTVRAKLGIS